MNSQAQPVRRCWCCALLFGLSIAALVYVLVTKVDLRAQRRALPAHSVLLIGDDSPTAATNRADIVTPTVERGPESWRDSMRKRFLDTLRKISQALHVLKQEPDPNAPPPGGG